MWRRDKRKVGLALGGGAARGLAHIGVIKVLEEEKINADIVAGTSIGAMIGALHAAGVPVSQIEDVARNVDWRQMARLIDPALSKAGLIDGRKVGTFMAELLPVRSFEELRLPFAVVTTDIETGETVIIKKGDLLPALQAAIAFPGIFTPVPFGDRFLVDGGLCNPVPVDVVKELGADAIIGVCTIPEVGKRPAETFLPRTEKTDSRTQRRFLDFFNSESVERLLRDLWRRGSENVETEKPPQTPPQRRPPGIFKICAQSVVIMENEINALRLERNLIDVLIRPEFNDITLLEFHRAAEAIQAGIEATRPLVGKIRGLCAGD